MRAGARAPFTWCLPLLSHLRASTAGGTLYRQPSPQLIVSYDSSVTGASDSASIAIGRWSATPAS